MNGFDVSSRHSEEDTELLLSTQASSGSQEALSVPCQLFHKFYVLSWGLVCYTAQEAQPVSAARLRKTQQSKIPDTRGPALKEAMGRS